MSEDQTPTEQDQLADGHPEQVLIAFLQRFAAIPVPGFELGSKTFDPFSLLRDRIGNHPADLLLEAIDSVEQDLRAFEGKARRFAAFFCDLPDKAQAQILAIDITTRIGA